MELTRGPDGSLTASLPPHFPFRVLERGGDRGRCLVTTREIRPEETVLTDSAILLGPASRDVCVVCCCSSSSGRLPSPCTSCGHLLCPLCSEAPQQANHAGLECKALKAAGYTEDMYNIILPLRFALLRGRDRDMFDWLLQYMDHNKDRALSNPGTSNTTSLMAQILCSSMQGLEVELATKIIGILFTNCFEFQLADIQARALYPLVSLVNHSCIPNTRHSNLINQLKGGGVEGEIVVMKLEAQRTIACGTEITIRYTDYLMSHLQRQRFLSSQWFFHCQCPRCHDPTEFGSLTSCLPCTSCTTGHLLPPTSPCCTPSPPPWVCRDCGAEQSLEQVEEKEQLLMRQADCRPEPYNIRSCLQQLHKFSKILHNNHFIIVSLKQKFLFSFSINMKKVRSLTPDQRRKLSPLFSAQEKYCRQLLAYHELLDPGQSSLKTKILLELRKVLLLQARVLTDDPESEKDDLAAKLNEIKGLSYLVYTKVEL